MANRFLTLASVLLLSACMESASAPAPVTHLGVRLDSVTGAVMVREGDTVASIARRYALPVRDIVDVNGLSPPYHLATGQRLLLPAPMEHRVAADDTLMRVARMYDVSLSQLVRDNGLKSPYILTPGQTLRIPSAVARQEQQGVQERRSDVALLKSPDATRRDFDKVVRKWESEKIAAPQARAAPPHSLPEVQTTVLGSSRPDFIWPLQGKVISSYGPKAGGLYNDGINIAAPRGTPVSAAADGVVAYVGDDLGSYGNLVLLRHGGGMVTAYAHLSSISVQKGASVRKGQAIGTVGSTGTVANTQLHFEVRQGSKTLDPRKYLG